MSSALFNRLLTFRRILLQSWQKPRYVLQVIEALPTLLDLYLVSGKTIMLVHRRAGIGDIVSTFPSLGTMKHRAPRSFIVYETHGHYLPLAKGCRHVDLAIEEGSVLAALLHRLLKPEMSLYPLLPDEQQPPKARGRMHLSDEFSRSFGLATVDEISTRLTIPSRALRQVKQRLRREGLGKRPMVVIHTGPTWRVKEWPAEKWSELVSRLKAADDVELIQIGEDETATGDRRLSPRVSQARDFVGTLDLNQSLALLSMASLFIGIDSGMMHLAGAVGTACVGIYGPTDPICSLPKQSQAIGVVSDLPCLGCHHDPGGPRHWRHGCPQGIRCMSELSPQNVFEACQSLLRPGA